MLEQIEPQLNVVDPPPPSVIPRIVRRKFPSSTTPTPVAPTKAEYVAEIKNIWRTGLNTKLPFSRTRDDAINYTQEVVAVNHPDYADFLLKKVKEALSKDMIKQIQDRFHLTIKDGLTVIELVGYYADGVGPELIAHKRAEERAHRLITNR